MKTYTEKDLKAAFNAGGNYYVDIERNGVTNLIESDFNEWLQKYNTAEKEEITLPFLFWQLDKTIDWKDLSHIIGVDYYKKSQIKKANSLI